MSNSIQNKNEMQSLRSGIDYARDHYTRVSHMLVNAIGEKTRAAQVLSMNSQKTVENLLASFSGMTTSDFSKLAETDPNKAIAVLKQQTRQLNKFLNGANRLLSVTLGKTMASKEGASRSRQVMNQEFSNDADTGVLDFLAQADNYLVGLNEGAKTKEQKQFLANYATWISESIRDIKNSLADALSDEIENRGIVGGTIANKQVKTRSSETQEGTTVSSKNKKTERLHPASLMHNSGTALITAETAAEINRINAINANLVKLSKVQKDEVEVAAVATVNKKNKNVGKKVATGVAAVLIAGAAFGAGYLLNNANQEKLKSENAKLEKDKSAIEIERDNYKDLYGDALIELGTANSAYEDLNEKYLQALEDYRQLKIMSGGQSEQIIKLRIANDKLAMALISANIKIGQLEKDNAELKRKLQEANNKDALITSLRNEINEKNKQIKSLQSQENTLTKDLDKANRNYADLLSKYNALVRELDKYGVKTPSELVAKLQGEINKANSERGNAIAEKNAAIRERDAYKTQYDELNEKYQKLLAEQHIDPAELEAAKREIARLEGVVTSLNKTIAEKDTALTAANVRIGELEGDLSDANATIATLRQQIIDAQNRIRALEEALDAAKTTSGAKEGGNGASQVGTGNNENNNDDVHVVNDGNDDDLTGYRKDDMGRGGR